MTVDEKLKMMLKLILSENPNEPTFIYTPKRIYNKDGIIVEGVDSHGIREFKIFYSKNDIYYYFNELNKRLTRK